VATSGADHVACPAVAGTRRGVYEAQERSTMGLTTDPNDPRLGRGVDQEPRPQNETYLVLSDEEREPRASSGRCASRTSTSSAVSITTMNQAIAETYARQPTFYGATYCCTCRKHLPVAEFIWIESDGLPHGHRVGS
jgi:hypothetical protein